MNIQRGTEAWREAERAIIANVAIGEDGRVNTVRAATYRITDAEITAYWLGREASESKL